MEKKKENKKDLKKENTIENKKMDQGSLSPQQDKEAAAAGANPAGAESTGQGSLAPQKDIEAEASGSGSSGANPTVTENAGQGSLAPHQSEAGSAGANPAGENPAGAESAGQGSLAPQDTETGAVGSGNVESTGQGSLAPQDAETGAAGSGNVESTGQGSLAPQDTETGAVGSEKVESAGQGSLAPQQPEAGSAGADPAGEKTAGAENAGQGSLEPQQGTDLTKETGTDRTGKDGTDRTGKAGTDRTAETGADQAKEEAARDAGKETLPPAATDPAGKETLPPAAADPSGKETLPPAAAENPGNSSGGKGKKGKKKARRGRKAFWITLLLLLLVIGGVYAAGYKYGETHFLPGTTVNGHDCSGLTEDEAENLFYSAAKNYVLNVHFRGGTTEILKADDIGFSYKPDGTIGSMLHGQDILRWPLYFFEEHSYTMEVGGSYDPDKLTQALEALPELQKSNMQAPENAYIRFRDGNDKEDGVFEIVPEDPGNTIDVVQLAAGVGDAAARYEEEIDAEQVAGAYKEAELKAEDASLISRCKDLNDLVAASITYVLPDKGEIRLNSDVTKDWLVRDEKGRLVKDDEVWDQKLWEFLEHLAINSNTLGMDRKFKTTARGTITVTGGDYGYMVNQIVEHDLLLEDFKTGKKETRKPSYYISPYNEEEENDGIGTTYMEVDLTAQHMWCYVDGKMVLESDVVTGDPTTGHETPTGVFGIMFMKKDATLQGIMQKNGKPEYETKVSYWMPFYADCGFHDAWWRTAFGGQIYKGDGSHGCVNMPVDAAKELFSICEDKMPVVVYK